MEQNKKSAVDGTLKFFDKFEDKIRANLSRHPIVYSLVGGVAIVLFWRGVWMTADEFEFLTGPVSILVSVVILLASGLFVSFFVGDQILISGLKKDKKLIEKTEDEIKAESAVLTEVRSELKKIEKELEKIEAKQE
jgi:hypothetical protein